LRLDSRLKISVLVVDDLKPVFKLLFGDPKWLFLVWKLVPQVILLLKHPLLRTQDLKHFFVHSLLFLQISSPPGQTTWVSLSEACIALTRQVTDLLTHGLLVMQRFIFIFQY